MPKTFSSAIAELAERDDITLGDYRKLIEIGNKLWHDITLAEVHFVIQCYRKYVSTNIPDDE